MTTTTTRPVPPSAAPGAAARRPRLKGHPDDRPAAQPKATGWHPLDWLCEYAGTAGQLAVGFCVVAVLESPRSPGPGAIPWGWLRLVLIGIAFGLLAAAVALSPIGRRSGAHLNPAVTVGFWLRGHTPGRDALGYVVAQGAGAVTAAAVFVAVTGSWSSTVDDARTVPQAGLPLPAAAAIEAGLTFGLMLTVFLMVSSSRTARWTPAVVTGVLAGLIWAGAPHTGASMNPARTLGPDMVAGGFPALWCYLVGPVIGAAAAAAAIRVFRSRGTLTAKLFHDSSYPSVHATALPAKPHHSSGQPNGHRHVRAVAR
ncbi:MAG TPA: aquaporin [Mycobacteriales bacterium]|nr:aquaporin [Mycobacteriales bacterium]